jgi:pimeloyl-ACP methyl ester carboxylesterase
LIEEDLKLKHRDSLEVRCTLRIPGGKERIRLVIVAPGFLAFKDWGFLPHLCQRLCQAGFAALSFSHSLSGVRENPYEITDAEAFSRNTTTQELKDWDLILDTILCGKLPYSNQLRLNTLGVVGHSRGGSYGILMASRVPQIQSVVTWGAIQTFQRFSPEVQYRWREEGYLAVGDRNRNKSLQLKVTALEALEQNYDRLDVIRAMRGLNIPVLILHGREDRIVPIEEGRKLWECADPCLSQFCIIEGAGHSLKTPHPFDHPSQPLTEAIRETIAWLQKTIRQS